MANTMDSLERIREMIYDEIDEMANQGQLTVDCVHILSEMIDIVKDCAEIKMYDEADFSQFQDDYYRNGGYSQRRPMMYYDNNSYRNGSYGRNGGYSRRGRGGYSRDDAKEHMIHKLENLMNEAQDQKDKDSIKKLIDQMEHDN